MCEMMYESVGVALGDGDGMGDGSSRPKSISGAGRAEPVLL
jgi:hypothetical protein